MQVVEQLAKLFNVILLVSELEW